MTSSIRKSVAHCRSTDARVVRGTGVGKIKFPDDLKHVVTILSRTIHSMT